MNLVAFHLIKCGVVTADKKAVGHFKVDDRRERRAAFGEIGKPANTLRDIPYRADGGLFAAQLFGDIGFDFLHILTIPTSSSSVVVQEIHIINTNERLKRKLDSFDIK